jgi:hypothetical protein
MTHSTYCDPGLLSDLCTHRQRICGNQQILEIGPGDNAYVRMYGTAEIIRRGKVTGITILWDDTKDK